MNPKKPNYDWYAIYTRPNWEKKINEFLQEEQIQCYLPLLKTLKQWSDRKKWIKEPLFKGYLFVKVSYKEFFNVLNVSGVIKYVSFGGKAQTVPESQIENIMTFLNQEEKEILITNENISKGIIAEVCYGPLKGLQGEIVQINGQSRILIRIETMGSSLYTNISKDEVKIMTREEANDRPC